MAEFDKSKRRPYKIFNVNVFEQFNPNAAIFNILVSPYSGDLYFSIAPAIPNNAAQKCRGPVPAGTKVYDYSKQVFSKLVYHEIVKIKKFMEARLEPNTSAMIQLLNTSKSYLEQLALKPGCDAQTGAIIQQLLQAYNSTLRGYGTDNNLPLYRKAQNSNQNSDNKMWSLSYDPNNETFFVSVTVNQNKDERIYLAIKKEYASYMYEVIKSYLENYTVLRVHGETTDAWSESTVFGECSNLITAYPVLQRCLTQDQVNTVNNKIKDLCETIGLKLSK